MTTKNVLIHIGYHKTASTWLQNTLFTTLNDSFHSLSSTPRGESTLAWDFVIDREGYPLSPFEMNVPTISKELLRLMEASPGVGRTNVISHERLSGHPYSAGYDAKAILERLHSVLPDAKVLIVIREQRSMIRSTYFQYLTAGGTLSIDNFFGSVDGARRPEFSPTYFEYDQLIETYYQKFSSANVLVLPYELLRDRQPAFLAAIGEFLGRPVTVRDNDARRKYNTKANHWTAYHCRLLNYCTHRNVLTNHSRLCNRFTKPPAKWLLAFVASVIPAAWDRRRVLEIEKVINQRVSNRFESSNLRTKELTGLDLAELGYAVSGG